MDDARVFYVHVHHLRETPGLLESAAASQPRGLRDAALHARRGRAPSPFHHLDMELVPRTVATHLFVMHRDLGLFGHEARRSVGLCHGANHLAYELHQWQVSTLVVGPRSVKENYFEVRQRSGKQHVLQVRRVLVGDGVGDDEHADTPRALRQQRDRPAVRLRVVRAGGARQDVSETIDRPLDFEADLW